MASGNHILHVLCGANIYFASNNAKLPNFGSLIAFFCKVRYSLIQFFDNVVRFEKIGGVPPDARGRSLPKVGSHCSR